MFSNKMSLQKSSLLEDIDRIQNYKNASQLPHQIIEMDKLSNKDILKIFYQILPSQILKIGPFYIFYLLKDADPVLWKAMLEYIRIFYNQTCREKISTGYKKNFTDANLMVLCISQDQEIYSKYKMDLLNGFLIANYDVPKKEANIILVCFQDIYNEGKKFKLGGGLFLHCLALNILTQLHIKDVYLEASDKNLIHYYGNIGYKLGKSPCGKRDKITDMYKEYEYLDDIIQKLPPNYADEQYDYAYRMKWCGFDERDFCFKAFETFRNQIGNVKEEMLKSKSSFDIEETEEYIGPKNDPKKYKIIQLITDKDYYKEYYGVSSSNQLVRIHMYSKDIKESDFNTRLKCIQKSKQFCDEFSCFLDTFDTSVDRVVITTSRDQQESLEEYLTKRYKNQLMNAEKITKNISKVLNDMYSLDIIPKISEKSIGIFPQTLEIYISNITCSGEERKNTLFIKEIYDTIEESNKEFNRLMTELKKRKDQVIGQLSSKNQDEWKAFNIEVKKFGDKVNEYIFKSYNITDNPFIPSTKKKWTDKLMENIENLHSILLNNDWISFEWRNEWLKLLNRFL
jgi:hypothetical protein